MGVFRSEVILHKKIRIPTESAIEVMDALGKLEEDSIEFIDLNKDNIEAKKNYSDMIKRCEEMDMKISNFELFSQDFNETLFHYKSFRHFLSDLEQDLSLRDRRIGTYFDLVENEILEEERKIIDLVNAYTKIKENLETLSEKKCVFDKSLQLIHTNRDISESLERQNQNIGGMIIEEGHQHFPGLTFLAGVIKADDDLRMKRMIFRASSGRALATFFDFVNTDLVNSKESSVTIKKKIFTIFFQGGNENILLHKLLKICDLFGASRYNIPRREDINDQVRLLSDEINEQKEFLKTAEISIRNFLKEKFGNEIHPGKMELYKLYFKKEKMIYHNLNKCLLRENFIDGEVWILEKHYQKLREILRNLNDDDRRLPASFNDTDDSITKPTYIFSNDFLYPFQEIVNTYGTPRYMEINPTYFNIVTFPFLFGVMFGDIGHGLLVTIFGLYLVQNAEKIKQDKKSAFISAIKARYLILMMGFFAFYCGWIYNDFFSVPLPIFGTCYEDKINVKIPYSIKTEKDCVYPIGIDPKWRVAKNELSFVNSFKMKLSVILGVSHMIFGIMLKGLNDFHFKNYIDFVFEFIPQILFMSILFGYMNIMIFIKWGTDWSYDTKKAPSIIALIMNIFLKFGSVADKPLWGGKNPEDNSYPQESFHKLVLLICVILIPIMLLPKPIIDYFKKKTALRYQPNPGFDRLTDEQRISSIEHRQMSDIHIEIESHHDHRSHGFGEIFIHQAIETIEFILGSVSNTASYLRLWALSLAHGELSKVFFDKTLLESIRNGDYTTGIFTTFFGFLIFANVTFFVLMCMDFMECFLHTLRLHWVEFQNKFFKADGYKFNPYSFRFIVESEE